VLVVVSPQHTLKLRDVSVRLTAQPALDEQSYRRAGTVVYTVPPQVHKGTGTPQRFPVPFSPGQLLLLVTFASTGNGPLRYTAAHAESPAKRGGAGEPQFPGRISW
jgi:hypothetical protein